jgi:predicted nuclease of predicted toxin-antitoxin system
VISFLVDQNFNEHIVDGLTRRIPTLDCILVRDVGLAAAPDPTILERAATQDRVLLTHDRRTIPPFAYARVAAGQPMPGVFLVSDDMPVGQAIDELLIAVHCLTPDECKDIVKSFPMS